MPKNTTQVLPSVYTRSIHAIKRETRLTMIPWKIATACNLQRRHIPRGDNR